MVVSRVECNDSANPVFDRKSSQKGLPAPPGHSYRFGTVIHQRPLQSNQWTRIRGTALIVTTGSDFVDRFGGD
jgi:hypothetical protein